MNKNIIYKIFNFFTLLLLILYSNLNVYADAVKKNETAIEAFKRFQNESVIFANINTIINSLYVIAIVSSFIGISFIVTIYINKTDDMDDEASLNKLIQRIKTIIIVNFIIFFIKDLLFKFFELFLISTTMKSVTTVLITDYIKDNFFSIATIIYKILNYFVIAGITFETMKKVIDLFNMGEKEEIKKKFNSFGKKILAVAFFMFLPDFIIFINSVFN